MSTQFCSRQRPRAYQLSDQRKRLFIHSALWYGFAVDVQRKVFKVLAYNASRRVWTMRDKAYSHDIATEKAEALQHKGLRVRVVPGTERVLTVKPPINCETRRWREEEMGKMLDRADAKKRYKSPG